MDAQVNEAAASAALNQHDLQRQQPPKSDGTETASKIPPTLYVLDTTAVDGPAGGPREHEMIVDGLIKSFKFEPRKPLPLPFPIAVKFLRIPAFIRTDAEGNAEPYARQPTQPHELGAGEQFTLKDDQTVADYRELSSMALWQRALELPGGEKLPQNRDIIIKFLIEMMVKRRKEKLDKQAGRKAPQGDGGEAELAEIEPATDDSDFD